MNAFAIWDGPMLSFLFFIRRQRLQMWLYDHICVSLKVCTLCVVHVATCEPQNAVAAAVLVTGS